MTTIQENAAAKAPAEGDSVDDIHLVPLSKIKVDDKWNVRSNYDGIEELGAQIKAQGLLTPLTVDQNFKLIAGFRRIKALYALHNEKDPDILVKVTVKEIELPHEALLMNIGENTGRESLNDYDLAKRLHELEDTNGKYGVKRAMIQRQTGLSATTISKLIQTYVQLAPAIKKAWAASYAGELKDAKEKTVNGLPTMRLYEWAKEEEKDQKKLLAAYLDGDRPLTKDEGDDEGGGGGGGGGNGAEKPNRAPTKVEIREYIEKLQARKDKDGLDDKESARLQFGKWVLGQVARPA
jgi:ParB-like chromosome segregation protein Spo0J